jgi:hypothetical protein
LFAFDHGKTIIVDEFLRLRGLASLGGLLVVKGRDRFVVDRWVNENGDDGFSSGSSRDLSPPELEVLRLRGERRVSLAGRWRLALRSEQEVWFSGFRIEEQQNEGKTLVRIHDFDDKLCPPTQVATVHLMHASRYDMRYWTKQFLLSST